MRISDAATEQMSQKAPCCFEPVLFCVQVVTCFTHNKNTLGTHTCVFSCTHTPTLNVGDRDLNDAHVL